MARRRERILDLDRLTGIEIADLADRLVEVWPDDERGGDAARARAHVDELARSAERLTRTVADLRAELARIEGRGDDDVIVPSRAAAAAPIPRPQGNEQPLEE